MLTHIEHLRATENRVEDITARLLSLALGKRSIREKGLSPPGMKGKSEKR